MGITMSSQEILFPLAILTNMKHFRARMDRLFQGETIDYCRRNVFKFEGDDIDRLDELSERGFIGIRPGKLPIRNLASRAIRRGLISMHSVAHSSGSDAEHSPELSAAENTNG